MQWFLAVLQKYATFTGRAQRKEYWMFVLFYLIFYIVAAIADVILATQGGVGLVTLIYSLALLIPRIAVTARRLHYPGRSGCWQLIYLVPLGAFIVMLVFLVQDSNPGDNAYGPNPKESAAAETVATA